MQTYLPSFYLVYPKSSQKFSKKTKIIQLAQKSTILPKKANFFQKQPNLQKNRTPAKISNFCQEIRNSSDKNSIPTKNHHPKICKICPILIKKNYLIYTKNTQVIPTTNLFLPKKDIILPQKHANFCKNLLIFYQNLPKFNNRINCNLMYETLLKVHHNINWKLPFFRKSFLFCQNLEPI